jgi:hypothetical protein
MRKARAYFVLVVVLAVLMLSACAAGPNEMVDTGPDPAGFWLGLWQGLISPVTFLISLFTPDVNIYEVQNNGNWYDFGFMLGVVMAFGGGAGGAEPRRLCRSYGPRRPPAGGVALFHQNRRHVLIRYGSQRRRRAAVS